MSWFSNFFDPPNPADSAQPYYDKIPGMLPGYYNPYIQQGQNATQPYMQGGAWAGQNLQSQLGQLTNDPGGMMNKFGAGFKQSPGYQFQVNQALGAANRASASGGMAGSPAEQQSIAGTVNGFANQDYYNYMNHVTGLYGQGLQGMQGMYNTGAQIGENMYDTSAQSSNDLASGLASSYMNQGNLSMTGQQDQNESQYGWLGALAGAGADFAGSHWGKS